MYSLSEVLSSIECDYELMGPVVDKIAGFSSIAEAEDGDLCFINKVDTRYLELLNTTKAQVIICKKDQLIINSDKTKLLILVDNPRLTFARVIRKLTSVLASPVRSFIHPTAIISENARLGQSVYIGAYVSIGDSKIGDFSRIEHHSRIHDNVVIGGSVLISEFCNVGGNGFGFIKNQSDEYEYFPHLGRVIIEDGVSLFPFVNVDRATLGVTRIGKGTKIDHYCHIGHNSKIGCNTLITPNVTTLGGVSIGDRCVIGCGSVFRESVKIGNDVTIGMCSSVTKDVPSGETWVGSPAREYSEFRIINSHLSAISMKSGID